MRSIDSTRQRICQLIPFPFQTRMPSHLSAKGSAVEPRARCLRLGKKHAQLSKLQLSIHSRTSSSGSIWTWVRDTHWRKAFGECHAISASGRYLIMERLESLPEGRETETPTLPSFVGDVWANNFGVDQAGVIKVRDYANINMTELVKHDAAYGSSRRLSLNGRGS